MEPPTNPIAAAKQEPLSVEETDQLVNAAESVPENLVIFTLLDTGLRVAEFAGLTKDSILWQERRATYIAEEGQRLFYYRQMMTARDLAGLREVAREIEDRYGRAPAPVKTALGVMECRLRSKAAGIRQIGCSDEEIFLEFAGEDGPSPRLFSVLNEKNPGARLSHERYFRPYQGDSLAACPKLLHRIGKELTDMAKELESLEAT